MPDYLVPVTVSEEELAVLRSIAMSPVTSVAVMDVKHPEGFAILQALGLVESNEYAVWCSPFGRRVLEAAANPVTDPRDAVVEAARMVRANYSRSECIVDPHVVDGLIAALICFDAAKEAGK